MGSQFNSYDSFSITKTMPPTLLLFTFSAMIISCKGECPSMNDIPVMYNDEAFTCARSWDHRGADNAIDSCNGKNGTYADGEDDNADACFYIPMGTIFVKPGCTLNMYKEHRYSGQLQTIRGPAEVYKNTAWDLGLNGPGPRSYKCRCIQKKVDCDPEDFFEVVLRCDGRNAVVDTKCTYSKTVGTEFSNEISEGMSVDTTVEAEMSAQFWRIFEARMGMSVTTGYDWGHVSTETKSEQTTITVEGTAPPGTVLVIEQVVGSCLGSEGLTVSEARTDFFKISHQDKDGNVLSQRVHRFLENQTFVDEIRDADVNLHGHQKGTERGGQGGIVDRGGDIGPFYSSVTGEQCDDGASGGASALIAERSL